MKNINYVEYLNNYEPKRISKIVAFAMRTICKGFTIGKNVKYTYLFDKKQYKGKQVCMLADHCSRNAFFFVTAGYSLTDFNIMVGYQNFFDKSLYNILLAAGCIPKYLYSPDLGAVKHTLRLAKEGASIMIFPEGIQSSVGSTHPMNPATLKLLKKLDMDIMLCSTKGTYLCNPRFTTNGFKKGPMEITYRVLFTREELKSMSVDEMYDRYLKLFTYNDFKWNKEVQNSYTWDKGNAWGFEKLLYKCPVCGSENNIYTSHDDICCKSCGLKVNVDDKYNLTSSSPLKFERIDEWYQYQREEVRKEVLKKDLYMEFPVSMRELDTKVLHDSDHKTIEVGVGKIILDKDNMRYVGTCYGEEITKIYEYSQIPSAPILPGEGFEVYVGADFNQYYFNENPLLSTKVMLVIEEMHNLTDPAWDKCSRDVYK